MNDGEVRQEIEEAKEIVMKDGGEESVLFRFIVNEVNK